MFEYIPVGERVLLKLRKKESTVIMPDAVKDQGWDLEADVVAVGWGDMRKNGVKVGDKVLLTPMMLMATAVYDRAPDYYTIINASQIFAIRKEVEAFTMEKPN